MLKIVIYILVFCVLFVLYVRYLESTSVFYPEKELLYNPGEMALKYEDVYFKTIDNVELHGWFLPVHENNQYPQGSSTMIFMHGNAGNIGDRLSKLVSFHNLGFNILIFDYRGYGKSKGRPTEKGMYLDAMAAYDYLKNRDDINDNAIFAYGASLGGAAAVDLAKRRPLAALVLDSTFSSAKDMSKYIVPFVPSFLLNVKLDSESKIKDMQIPKLMFHSPEDETVPYVLGKKLFDAAAKPKEWVDIAGTHNEGYTESEKVYLTALRTFLQKYNLLD